MAEPGPRHERFTASPGDAGRRLDLVLAERVPALSRAQAQRLIRDGCVRLSAGTARPSLPLRAGLVVDVAMPAPAPAAPQPEDLPLTILHDDEDLVVIDKPAGMVVHPAAGHAAGTLVNALLHHVGGLSGIGGTARPGIVHRLDRGTSGVMVVAKHDRAHQALSRQFQDRSVGKEYIALVWGAVGAGGTIERPIGRDPTHRHRMSGRARRARPAVTRIVEAESIDGLSLLRLTIGTGRTHQIRVHLSETGHPVVGDALYGGVRKRLPARLAAIGRLTRPFLHASRLTFRHPSTGRTIAAEAPLPADLAETLARVRRAVARAPEAR